MIGIIDYGASNLKSVQNALTRLHASHMLCENKEDFKLCDRLILPGVGAFADCMEQLRKRELIAPIQAAIAAKVPFLGICLGMQLLFESSDEIRHCEGLGIFKGHIKRMEDTSVKIPHIGWNELVFTKENSLFQTLKHPYVYYVHSYYATSYEEHELIAYSIYGNMKVPGVFHKDHVWACQFHPEKSGEEGLMMLKNFLAFEG